MLKVYESQLTVFSQVWGNHLVGDGEQSVYNCNSQYGDRTTDAGTDACWSHSG